jgi:arsenate reductase
MLKLLFICTHNRCRSILAEAITRHIAGNVFDVRSAGSQPAGVVFDGTLNFLHERGISAEGLHSESWDAHESFKPDVVITVCDNAAGEACPLWMGDAIRVHWGLSDPSKMTDAQAQQQAFTEVADVLTQRIKNLAQEDWASHNKESIQQLFNQQGAVI